MGQGSTSESVDEFQAINLDPEMIIVGPTGVTSICSTKHEGNLLVATSQGTITLFDIEEKKQLKNWTQNRRLTNIVYNYDDNTFLTTYFSFESEEPNIKEGLVNNYVIFLDTVAKKEIISEMAGDGILKWNFEDTKSTREIGERIAVMHKHGNDLLLQRKPGLIEEYIDGEFKTFIDAKITKFLILSSLGKNLIGVVAGTADIYSWDENRIVLKLHDGDGSEDCVINCLCGIDDTILVFGMGSYLYFIEMKSKRMRSFGAHDKKITALCTMGDEFLVSCDLLGNLKFWDISKIKGIFPDAKKK
jgi:WD40 repeat protein